MKISAIGSRKQKRAVKLVLEAKNEIEEAVLFEMFEKFCEEPPALNPYYQQVLTALGVGGLGTDAIGDRLNIPATNANNRLASLLKMNLVRREIKEGDVRGRAFLYWLNLRALGEPKPSKVLESEDE